MLVFWGLCETHYRLYEFCCEEGGQNKQLEQAILFILKNTQKQQQELLNAIQSLSHKTKREKKRNWTLQL